MSITDELREWAKGSTLSTWTAEHLTAIADRIDAEHESACAEAYGNGVMSVPIALDESAWVELPKDADGEPIHVGDVMELTRLSNKPSFEVRAMRYDEGGWEVYDRLGDRYAPSLLRHHHAPNVEDVLTEFAAKLIERGELTNGAAQTIAEYAKRLTLAEEEDA